MGCRCACVTLVHCQSHLRKAHAFAVAVTAGRRCTADSLDLRHAVLRAHLRRVQYTAAVAHSSSARSIAAHSHESHHHRFCLPMQSCQAISCHFRPIRSAQYQAIEGPLLKCISPQIASLELSGELIRKNRKTKKEKSSVTTLIRALSLSAVLTLSVYHQHQFKHHKQSWTCGTP